MTCFLKRALPFMLTLIIGIGLGSIFGFNRSSTTTDNISGFKMERRYQRHHCMYGERSISASASDVPPFQPQTHALDITFQPSVRYTPEAIQHQTTGVVQLCVSFNADGTATVLEKLSTLPDGLTDEAVRVAEGTEFTPEKVDGQPVPVVKEMNYIFTLNDSMTMETK